MKWANRLGIRLVKLLPSEAAHPHQPHVAQHTQMLGDGRLLQAQGYHDVRNRPLGSGKIAQDLPSAGLSHRVECV